MKKITFILFVPILAAFLAGCDPQTPAADKDLTYFGFKDVNPVTAEIDGGAVMVSVPYGTDTASLIATFVSTGVSVAVDGVEQVSGITENDFTSPLRYTVNAEDGSTLVFVVIVTVQPGNEKDIESFRFAAADNSALGDVDVEGAVIGNEINLKIDYSENVDETVKTLIPTFTTSGETVTVGLFTQISGVDSQNFTSPVIYTVTAADGTTKEYTVNVYIKVTRAQLDTMIAASKNVKMADTSGITDMSSLLYNNFTFNQNISRWDVSNVTDMSDMFHHALSFNQDLSGWDVGNVTNMEYMFCGENGEYNTIFNQDISGWDVSSVTNMQYMFYYCGAFLQDLSGWDVSNVANHFAFEPYSGLSSKPEYMPDFPE